MIDIRIKISGHRVLDKTLIKESTLLENAVALRRLEEIKRNLLERDYETDLEVEENE